MRVIIMILICLAYNIIFGQDHVVEKFESNSVEALKHSGWKDIIEVSIPATAPDPSFQIIETKNEKDKITSAVQLKKTVSTSCGMFKAIKERGDYYMQSDVRIDSWSNSSRPFFTDWAIAIGFFTVIEGWDFNGGPQITFVAQPVSNNLVLYALRADAKANEFFNIEFPEKVELNVWYCFSIYVENKTGKVHTKVIEKDTNKTIHNTTTLIPDWDSENSGNFKNFGFWDGEYNTDATKGNQVTIDNILFSRKSKKDK
ncbi:hypothetical protein [uncultured Psychroserpens sp.]|uniref:hypothetical protein n=1 Tax=uncultured Psychroserpens sp. TaxID=255436 RepID=UPI0026060506|nr:hypothetical protein [uncultured Psychroserpens sp.]